MLPLRLKRPLRPKRRRLATARAFSDLLEKMLVPGGLEACCQASTPSASKWLFRRLATFVVPSARLTLPGVGVRSGAPKQILRPELARDLAQGFACV